MKKVKYLHISRFLFLASFISLIVFFFFQICHPSIKLLFNSLITLQNGKLVTFFSLPVSLKWSQMQFFTMKLKISYKKQKYFFFNFTTFSSPSYYVWGILVILQNFDFRFLTDLHVLGSEECKNTKLALYPGVRQLASMLVCYLVCQSAETISFGHAVLKTSFRL